MEAIGQVRTETLAGTDPCRIQPCGRGVTVVRLHHGNLTTIRVDGTLSNRHPCTAVEEVLVFVMHRIGLSNGL